MKKRIKKKTPRKAPKKKKRSASKVSYAKLGVRRTPDATNRRRYGARSSGVRTGLGIYQFWVTLFELNESLGKTRKMTDEEIKRQVQEEFPNRRAALRLGPLGKKGEETVNSYRKRYNIGRLTSGKVPTIQSKRYGYHGEEVNGRTGKPLS